VAQAFQLDFKKEGNKMVLKISILDRSPANEGESPGQALANTIALATAADRLGFHRFWVSEHHGSDVLLGSSPEVLISYLLARTGRIRVGSGGVMLQHYSPFKVAENFNLLATLAGDRVDLGIGRAPGGLPEASKALKGSAVEVQPLDQKLIELAHFIRDRRPEGEQGYRLQAQPLPAIAPSIFLLGANAESAALAASQGLAYVYAHFINGNAANTASSIAAYQQHFDRSSGRLPALLLGVSVLVAPSAADAEEQARAIKTYKVKYADGKSLSINTLAAAELLGEQSGQAYSIEIKEASIIHGSPASIGEKLTALQDAFQVDELIVLPAAHTFEARRTTYEVIADALLSATVAK
jgi:luciferase family oxidoreductase group 1